MVLTLKTKRMTTPDDQHSPHQQEADKPFFPKGSIAFFILMILFFIAVWFAFFALTVSRS